MSISKTYAVFGLGRYGKAVARELVANGAEVLAVDRDEAVVNALISEIPYNLFFCGKPFYLQSQNVYITLFLGFIALYILENIKNDTEKAIYIFGIVVLSIVLKGDYGVRGVILIILLYLLKNQLPLASALSLGLLSGGAAAWCAFVPINMYNGKRGFIKGKAVKYAFYAFYPVHMLIFYAIRKFIIL